MFVPEEISEKKNRVRKLLEALNLDAVYLKKSSNFSWITGGGYNIVGMATELGVAGILLTRDRGYVICQNIEAPRMEKEELLAAQGYEIKPFPWYEDQEAGLVARLGGKAVGADHGLPGTVDISAQINPLRYSLTRWEVERYKEQGRLTALAAEETARDIRPGDTERAVIGRLAERLWAQGMDFIIAFCAADERISLYRHPVATDRKIEQRAMISVNSRRKGLIVSLTRFVQFGRVPDALRDIYEKNVYVDCAMMSATIPGRPAIEVFRTALDAYKEKGYPDEYRLHHQGGAIGYVGRDYKVNFETKEIICENQGFAWNPSITGTKSEDTMLATSVGPVVISEPELFPVLLVESGGYNFRRPNILEL